VHKRDASIFFVPYYQVFLNCSRVLNNKDLCAQKQLTAKPLISFSIPEITPLTIMLLQSISLQMREFMKISPSLNQPLLLETQTNSQKAKSCSNLAVSPTHISY